MTRFPSAVRPIAVAASLTLLALGQAHAQTEGEKKDPNDTLSLDRVIVTGTSVGASKMKQSVSISTLDAEQIARQAPTNTAEVLRSIPGVRAESSGGEGNANLTVRGVPVSAGGARYVQFQEDGLPILLFGDIAFGTADQFMRVDYNIDRLEVIRGGTASTQTTNSPGGIINFISKTGESSGGAVGLTLGVDGGRQVRVDADYGARLGADLRFHVGGFQRVGEGDRPTGYNAAKGGQIKANITKNLGGGNYLRASIKALDDQTPTLLPVPTYLDGDKIKRIPGIDPRTAVFIDKNFPRDTTLNKNGGFTTSDPRDGLSVKSTALGLEGRFGLGAGVELVNRFRTSDTSGRFIGLFPSNSGDGATPTTSTTFTGVLFNTAIDSLDHTVNDLKVNASFGDAASGKATVTGGLFYSQQKVALTWFWNRYTVQMKNSGADVTFLGDGWDTFGGCCVRNFNVKYTTLSPYAGVTWEQGPLTVDASVRRDGQKASGYARQDDAAQQWDDANRQKVDYKVNHTSYSLGANYQIDRDMAVFARASDGVSFSADRLLYGNPLDGSVPVAKNEVQQLEAGVKFRSGGFSSFVTLFQARTKESNYEATTQRFTSNKYKATGLELELGWRMGNMRLAGGATLTDAEITASQTATEVGNTPRRQAKMVYQLSPSYSFGDIEVGAAVIGTGKSYGNDANTIIQPGFTVVNLFGNYQITDQLSASLGVNNLANTIGYTEVEGDGHAARSINGRTVKLGMKYTF
jgi:outer membrane receptor protein involved in Fe transport